MQEPINSVSATVHWKHFRQYFSDAAYFAFETSRMEIKDGKDEYRQKLYTHSAITFSAIALESAANCCLDFLDLSKASFEEYEQLRTLAKFELFLQNSPNKVSLDREHVLVRPIRNLIQCRNATVHSKVQKDQIIKGRIEPQVWEPLGLPHNPEYWQPLHAVKCFTVLSDFLNHLFFQVLGVPTEDRGGRSWVAQVLSSTIVKNEDSLLPGGVEWGPVQDNGSGNLTVVGGWIKGEV